ncbi:BapA/Bap/LapF family large adhesin, partial [Acinetobacter haemolyticus]|uniref:BapA/Bap/LapF family large adhesin n=1 Tax=Acinetobacter haemolyticus TaxID=29430 RepID=UPI00148EEC5C
GTAVADEDGNYTVVLDEPLTNGEVVDVTATDEAGNESDPTEAVAPDTTAPSAPTAEFNEDGSEVSGTAEAGSTVTVKDKDGNVLGTAVADEDGNYTVVLDEPLTNGEEVDVTATDEAGNESDPTEAVAPDTTAPAAPTAEFNEDGSEVSGTAEPGSTVTVKDKDGNVLGTAVTDEDGNYNVELEDPLNDGEVVDVTATDASGNESDPIEITAPDIQVDAVDNLVTAGVDFEYPVTTDRLEDVISDSWLIGVFGRSYSTQFTVDENTIQDIVIEINSGSIAGLFDGVGLKLSVLDDNGNWIEIADSSSGGLFDFIGIFGQTAEIAVNGLNPGQYKLDMTTSGLSFAGSVEVDIAQTIYDTAVDPIVSGVTLAEGNVITDTDDIYGQDDVPASVVVSEVDGQPVTGETTILGDYGTLVIHPDGTYIYTPNSDVTAIGKTEVFEYTVTDPVTGKSDTANLIIQIGTNSDLDLTWDAEEPTANAETVVATDNADLIGVDATNVTDTVTGPQISESWLVSFLPITRTVQSDVITIDETTIGNIEVGLSTTTLISLGGAASVAFQKLVDGVWVTQDTISASSLADLIGLFPNGNGKVYENQEAGQYRFELSYTRGAGIAGNVTVSTEVTTIHLDDFTATPIDSVVGNIYTDDDGAGTDILASIYTDLFVSADGGATWTQVTSTGTDFVGNHGTLSIKSDGSYTYDVTDSGLTGGASDEFTYKLVAPNGDESIATLTLNAGVIYTTSEGGDFITSSAGNDIYTTNGGADTVIFDLLDNADALGGNGHDTWTDFNLAEGDKIDITELLAGQTVDGDNIGQFVTVTQVGNDTVISVDRDGGGSSFNATELLTLKNTDVTLEDLLQNNQLLF